jgi:hypothetical protein
MELSRCDIIVFSRLDGSANVFEKSGKAAGFETCDPDERSRGCVDVE